MTNAELTTILETATKIRINGARTTYTVIKSSDMGADLVGPRGGVKHIVRNINSGNLRLISPSSSKLVLVTSLEMVA